MVEFDRETLELLERVGVVGVHPCLDETTRDRRAVAFGEEFEHVALLVVAMAFSVLPDHRPSASLLPSVVNFYTVSLVKSNLRR